MPTCPRLSRLLFALRQAQSLEPADTATMKNHPASDQPDERNPHRVSLRVTRGCLHRGHYLRHMLTAAFRPPCVHALLHAHAASTGTESQPLQQLRQPCAALRWRRRIHAPSALKLRAVRHARAVNAFAKRAVVAARLAMRPRAAMRRIKPPHGLIVAVPSPIKAPDAVVMLLAIAVPIGSTLAVWNTTGIEIAGPDVSPTMTAHDPLTHCASIWHDPVAVTSSVPQDGSV